MLFPFQCLVARSSSLEGSKDWHLIGASGSKLVAQSSTGTTATWTQQEDHVIADQDGEIQERPGKRVKLSPAQNQKSSFTHLVLTGDGRHLVGVTGEDKCIRVFQIDSSGHIRQLSERCMSRRPSSIALASNDSVILCADKFGDVYSLPLLPGREDIPSESPINEQPEEQKDFTPAASVLTVHSGRNRKTLEEQLKQKAKAPPKPKELATFKHDLLLGHVSMLTDLAYTKVESRSYIITADRDEHIRISRGPPQAHIIEGFCFGHDQFVSRLCLTASGLLVSGGGDADLLVWDWQKYQLLQKLPLRSTALQTLRAHPRFSSVIGDESAFKIAVSGIWPVPSDDNESGHIIVACEGIPALFVFNLNAPGNSGVMIPLSGNALSLAFIQQSSQSCVAIVSVDNMHQPGSTTEWRDESGATRLHFVSSQIDGSWHEDPSLQERLEWFASQGVEVQSRRADGGLAAGNQAEMDDKVQPGPADDKAVDFLYHVENLRKRPGADE